MAKFRARARAVDMLGRQQIAGVPNAISELLKNAYDAYADHVEADYFFSDDLLVLRDDGIGMTEAEFLERWLTLGTESKLGAQGGIKPPPKDPGKPARPISGEKGIGRLAIAAIGPQVLVLTRAGRGDELHDLVAAFIHWGVFELPGVNLDEIDIPVELFPGGTLPTAEDIGRMVDRVRDNLTELQERLDPLDTERIHQNLDRLRLDRLIASSRFLATQGDELTLEASGRGTHFFILPVVSSLEEDIRLDAEEKDEVSRLRRLLVGFTNTMTPDRAPAIKYSFRYWQTDDISHSYLEASEFWTPTDLAQADHRFVGSFDEFGTFRGEVRVYDQEPVEFELPWLGSRGEPTDCGPLRIDIGHIQGTQRESMLPPDDFARLYRKAARIGGVYIFRDGIRMLPYGDADFDWLEIEKRRNLGMTYYFFSYRRMFGAVQVTRNDNSGLQEKAGREGFRENKAYRQFKKILMNFFIQLAAEFFRKDAPREQLYRRRQAELERRELARREAEKITDRERRRFERTLDTSFGGINDGRPQKQVATLLENAKRGLQRAVSQGGRDLLGNNLLLEEEVRILEQLESVRKAYHVDRPEGVGLSADLGRDWLAYSEELERLERDIFGPAELQLHQLVNAFAQQAELRIDRQERIERLVGTSAQTATTSLRDEAEATQSELENTRQRVLNLVEQLTSEMAALARGIETQVQQLEFDRVLPDELEQQRLDWEREIEAQASRNSAILSHVQAQLKEVDWRVVDGHFIGTAEMKAALEEEVLALREHADLSLELSQLGMAIEIINHEFNQTIQDIRANIAKLRTWADANPKLESIYQGIRTSFEHLDGYLKLFTPLHRRLYRQTTEIKGGNIAKFLSDLFGERLTRDGIELVVSPSFREKTVTAYPSTIYPVFVNLVDNSTFWLRGRHEPREIHLDADEEAFIVWDTGPGIPVRDREAVFEMGFTRKPGGRGLGLYIAKQVLNREGFELELTRSTEERGATFQIIPKRNSDGRRSQ